MERRSFIPEEQLDLLLNAPMDPQAKLQELNDWERWQRERTPNHRRVALHPWFLCGGCGRPTQGDPNAGGSSAYCGHACDPRVRKGKSLERSCERCSRIYQAPAAKSSSQRWRFCSTECWRLAKGTAVERRCVVCDARILVATPLIDDGTPYHCSNRCRRIAKGTLSTTSCAHCLREFDILSKVLLDGRPHYCSMSCSSTGSLPDAATLSARGAFAVSSSGTFVSSIEAPVEAALERLGIEFEAQHLFTHPDGLHSCVADFYLPDDGAVCEVQGTYWHADPYLYQDDELNETQLRGRERYARKVELYRLLGLELIEVWEREIPRVDAVLIEALRRLRERRSVGVSSILRF